MSYTSERKARILAQLTKVQAALDALYDLRLEMSAQGVKSYEFESGEGRQKTTRRSLVDVNDQISRLEATERSLLNEKYNCGIVSVRVRRKYGSNI